MTIPVLAWGEPVDAIPGDPYALRALAVQMAGFAADLDLAAGELAAIDCGAWRGSAADAFHSVVHQQPRRYLVASEAFALAGAAVSAYATVLEDAQMATARAAQVAEAADEATRMWHSSAAAAGRVNPGSDPGSAEQQLAMTISSVAGADLGRAAAIAVATLRGAESDAPHAPSAFGRMLGDYWRAVAVAPANCLIGVAKGTWGTADGLYQLAKLYEAETNPLVAAVDPAMKRAAGAEVSALGQEVTGHPLTFLEDLGKGMVDWTEWTKNPDQAFGELLPTILLTVVTAGGGTAIKTSDAAGIAAKLMEKVVRTVTRSAPREVLPTPTVSDGKLARIVTDLYKGTSNPNRIGTGTTADAVRSELATGNPTGGTFHLEKATQYSRALSKILKTSLNPYDHLVAQSLLDDLEAALKGSS